MSQNLRWKPDTPDDADDGTHCTVSSVCSYIVPATLLKATAACMYDDDDEADMVTSLVVAQMAPVSHARGGTPALAPRKPCAVVAYPRIPASSSLPTNRWKRVMDTQQRSNAATQCSVFRVTGWVCE